MGLKSSHWSCSKARFKGYTFCFTTFLVRPSSGAHQSHERAPKKVQSFVCVPPWRRVTFKFLEMLKNSSDVTFVSKNIFFLKILNSVQKFRGVQSKTGWRYVSYCRQPPEELIWMMFISWIVSLKRTRGHFFDVLSITFLSSIFYFSGSL
jgi:hypothetical protein